MFKILLLAAIFLSVRGANIPPELLNTKCERFDPNINNCLLKLARRWLPILCDGIKHANIPTFDPLRIHSWRIKYNHSQLVVDAELPQININGHKQAHIDYFTFNAATLSGQFQVSMARFRMYGPAKVKAKILDFPINNQAFYTWKFVDFVQSFNFVLKSEIRNGEEYFTIDSLTGKRYVDNVDLDLKPDNPADRLRDDSFVSFVKSNQQKIVEVMDDYQSKVTADMYKMYFDPIFERIPAKYILPNNQPPTGTIPDGILPPTSGGTVMPGINPTPELCLKFKPKTFSCYRHDPNLNFCLLNKLREMWPTIYKGDSGLNIPPLDPLYIPKWKYNKDTTAINLQNIFVIGHKNASVQEFTLDLKKLSGRVKLHIPIIWINAEAEVKGKPKTFINIDNHAVYEWLLNGVTVEINYTLKSVTRDLQEYFSVRALDVKADFKSSNLKLQSMDPIDQEKDDMVAKLFNEDPTCLSKFLATHQDKISSGIYMLHLNLVLEKIPVPDMLSNNGPDDITQKCLKMFRGCYRYDPNVGQCLTGKILAAMQMAISSGNIISSFDPLYIKEWTRDNDYGTLQIKDLIIIGNRNSLVEKITFDPYTLSGQIKIINPKLRLSTNANFIPKKKTPHFQAVQSEAIFNSMQSGVVMDFRYQFKSYEVGGVEFFTIDSLSLGEETSINSTNFQIQYLDPNRQKLVEQITRGYNGNSVPSIDYLKIFIFKYVTEVYKDYFNSILQNYPTAGYLL